jgi:hypothetical protein
VIDTVFDQCVLLLVFLAGRLGLSYKALNVWVFVVTWPLVTLTLIAAVTLQQVRIRKLLNQLGAAGRAQPELPESHRGTCL